MTKLDWFVTVTFGILTTGVGLISMLAFGFGLVPQSLAIFSIICCLIAYVGIGYYIASIGVRK